MTFYEDEVTYIDLDLIEIVKVLYKSYSTILYNSQELSQLVLLLDKKIEKIKRNDKVLFLKRSDINKLKKLFFLVVYGEDVVISNNMNDLIEENLDEQSELIKVFIDRILSNLYIAIKEELENATNLNSYDKNDIKQCCLNAFSNINNKVKNSKTINEFMDSAYEIYVSKSSGYYTRTWSLCMFDIILKSARLVTEKLYETNLPFKQLKKKIEKFISDYESSKIVSQEDAKEILSLYNPKSLKLNEQAIISEIKKHNDEVAKKEKDNEINNRKDKNTMILETREERIRRYNQEKLSSNYIDAGDVSLTSEELECLDMYFSVIESLRPNQIEDFENKTPEFLPMLLDGYPNRVITLLIDKIENSNIEPQLRKRICKAVRHLS